MLHVEEEQVRLHLLEGNFGLEEESLRVLADGSFAHTEHPFPEDDHIVCDFSENQSEINTGVHPSAAGAMRELKEHRDRLIAALQARPQKEYLWPSSNPAFIRNEEDIPIALFAGRHVSKTRYREYLSDKYGRYKMTFSGIHVNYSFSDTLLRIDYGYRSAEEGELSFEEYRDGVYLYLAQGLVSYGWILVALTAASPVMDSSYFEKGVYGKDVFAGMASVRCSELGYWNAFAPLFDYTDIRRYADSMLSYVQRGILRAPSELYYPIRLKSAGENSLRRLKETGVNHIELRMFDLNPLVETGLEERDVVFAQLLMIWLVCTPRRPLEERDQIQAVQNYKNAARYDLKTVKIMDPSGESISAADEAKRVIDEMLVFFRSLPEGHDPEGTDTPDFPESSGELTTIERIEEVLWFERRKITEPTTRYAWQLRQTKDNFVQDMLRLAQTRQDEN